MTEVLFNESSAHPKKAYGKQYSSRRPENCFFLQNIYIDNTRDVNMSSRSIIININDPNSRSDHCREKFGVFSPAGSSDGKLFLASKNMKSH